MYRAESFTYLQGSTVIPVVEPLSDKKEMEITTPMDIRFRVSDSQHFPQGKFATLGLSPGGDFYRYLDSNYVTANSRFDVALDLNPDYSVTEDVLKGAKDSYKFSHFSMNGYNKAKLNTTTPSSDNGLYFTSSSSSTTWSISDVSVTWSKPSVPALEKTTLKKDAVKTETKTKDLVTEVPAIEFARGTATFHNGLNTILIANSTVVKNIVTMVEK